MVAAESITVLITYRARSGKAETVRSEVESLIRTVVAEEPDCLTITFHQGDTDDAEFMLYERWTSREAYEGPHMQTPHMKTWIEKAQVLVAGPPEITFWHVRGEESRSQ